MTAKPRLRRSDAPRPKVGIVHLGPGAFFRAFCATFTAEAMKVGAQDWGICGVSLRSPAVRDQMAPQDCAFTSITQTPEGPQDTIVEIVDQILVAPENPGAVLDMMAAPHVRIVSMTITEKGYGHNPISGVDAPDILHDLKHPNAPRTAIGFLVHALARRRSAGTPPFTVLSCDNLPDNGALTQNVVCAFAKALSPELAQWIAANVRFPSTMVDRITPATTDADIAALADRAGYLDPACVMHEPFRQWVIQDDFVGGARPAWGAVGAQFVTDVAPFETMKLRCLNGAHSALAYLGYLAGHETISDTVGDPDFAAYLDLFWQAEVIPSVPPPEGTDLQAYCASLKDRFLNPAIRHRTRQIAMDGSQKIPQRLLGTIADCVQAGRPFPCLALAVAGWIRYVLGMDEHGALIDVRDPLVAPLQAASTGATTPDQVVASILGEQRVFDPALAAESAFVAAVTSAYGSLVTHGARDAIRRLVTHN